MNGTDQSPVKVTLRNPLNTTDLHTYTIIPENNQLARDWILALTEILQKKLHLEKNFCFLGFPHSERTVEYLCDQLNRHVTVINYFNTTDVWQKAGLEPYWIKEIFTDSSVRYPNDASLGRNQYNIKHDILNKLHNHFETLQGTVWNLSVYYKTADANTRYSIRQLNNICHELESLILSQRKLETNPEWVRPSQITTFIHASRYELTDEHRKGFLQNRYDRVMGGVYMHWTQIGKTLFEVWRDESAPALNIGDNPTDISIGSGATCEAITALKFYSGEFDIEWGRDVVSKGTHPWHDKNIQEFQQWLADNKVDYNDPQLSLGYLKIGQVDLKNSFSTDDPEKIWQILGQHLDIYGIEVNGIAETFDYCWSDPDHTQCQIENLQRKDHEMD